MANEKRLIDANAMHKFVEDKVAEGKDGWANGVPYEWAYALTAVDMQPTVDAVEVVHGEWDVITDDCTFDVIYQCSVCKEEFVTNDGTPAENLWHYCPNCGAKMDGGNEDG